MQTNTDKVLATSTLDVNLTEPMVEVLLDYGSEFLRIETAGRRIGSDQPNTWRIADLYGDHPEPRLRGLQDILRAMVKVAGMRIYASEYVRKALLTGDAGYLDAECADVIWQEAAFGEVIYG